MKQFILNFSWGTWSGYFEKTYLAQYDLSGEVTIKNGTITDTQTITYTDDPWGPFVKNRRFSPYGKTTFTSHIHNWMAGLRVVCTGDDSTTVTLSTKEGSLTVSPAELYQKKLISREIGPKYSMLTLYAETDDPWFLAKFPACETVARLDLREDLPRRDWFSVRGAFVGPGETLSFPMTLSTSIKDSEELTARFRLRFLTNGDTEKEVTTRCLARFVVKLNGKTVWGNTHFSTFHDSAAQFLEEVFFDIPAACLKDGENLVEIENREGAISLSVPLAGIALRPMEHMQVLSAPRWAAVGQTVIVSLWCSEPSALITMDYDHDIFVESVRKESITKNPRKTNIPGLNSPQINQNDDCPMAHGENNFYFVVKKGQQNACISFTDRWTGKTATVTIPQLWEVPGEPIEPKLGIELKTGSPQEYQHLVWKVTREQLGNLVVFRDYHNDCHNPGLLWDAAALCRKNGLYTDTIVMNEQQIVADASADRSFCVGSHENTGIFYGRDLPENKSKNMKEAAETAAAKLGAVAKKYRTGSTRVGVGDASGGSRYAYQGGWDILRCETFVGHHALLMPNARGAARAYHKKDWGTHIASQHNAQPELDFGKRRFWLGMYLSWVMGATFMFEEDTLFMNYKYSRMIGDDWLCAQKTAITKDLYKFALTHPRTGHPLVPIAVAQGQYAPPISGISCANNDVVNDFVNENYPVWAHTGVEAWEWGYRQPEKGLHLLDILAPGVFLDPLHQNPRKVRKFFSGDPKGEFDFLPVEAGDDLYRQYQLLLFLDWHTMEEDCYHKLVRYARQGGTVFLSLPQCTTRSDRRLLLDMEDLQLCQDGDLSELCGVRVLGREDAVYTDAKPVGGWSDLVITDEVGPRTPNASPDEDGPCHLARMELLEGTEVLVRDAATDTPILMRRTVGEGTVYFLGTYAFPGHEALSKLMYAAITRIVEDHGSTEPVFNEIDPDLYRSVWGEENAPQKLFLLNTDWTTDGNKKPVDFVWQGLHYTGEAPEGALTELTLGKNCILQTAGTESYLRTEETMGLSTRYTLYSPEAVSLRYLLKAGHALTCDGTILVPAAEKDTSGEITIPCTLNAPRQLACL